jgi:hypothetical protein
MSARSRDKLRKRLAKRRKQREQRPGQSLVNLKPASHRVIQRVSRDHVDVLQNIEFAIVDCYREEPRTAIDDALVLKALRQSLLGTEPDDSPQGLLVEALASVRQLRSEISDQLWSDAIRVVMASVQNHSHMAPGETRYLDFVSRYIK